MICWTGFAVLVLGETTWVCNRGIVYQDDFLPCNFKDSCPLHYRAFWQSPGPDAKKCKETGYQTTSLEAIDSRPEKKRAKMRAHWRQQLVDRSYWFTDHWSGASLPWHILTPTWPQVPTECTERISMEATWGRETITDMRTSQRRIWQMERCFLVSWVFSPGKI